MFTSEPTGAGVWLVPLLVFSGVVLLGFLMRSLLFRTLKRATARTKSRIDDHLLSATRWPSVLWILIFGMLAAAYTMDLPGEGSDVLLRRVLGALLVVSITIGASRFTRDLVQGARDEVGTASAAPVGLLSTTVRALVLLVGLLVALGTLGIKITPILGALGVGGLAVGLALQPTLSNFFAGLQITMSKQVLVGNRIRLQSGEDGYVTDITWRTTTLRTPANHLVIIPNARFTDSIVTNLHMPGPKSNITLTVNIDYASDPRRVDAVLRDEAQRAVAELPQLVKEFEPVIRLQAFGESALNFVVIFQVQDFDDQFTAWGELHQRFFERLRREGISIPFPARTLHFAAGSPPLPAPKA